MICSACPIWEEYKRLKVKNSEQKGRIIELGVENGKLKRQLALYQNIKAPLLRRKHHARQRLTSDKRFPGKPKGSSGSTRAVAPRAGLRLHQSPRRSGIEPLQKRAAIKHGAQILGQHLETSRSLPHEFSP